MSRITLFVLATACLPVLAGPELKRADVLSVVNDAMPELQKCGVGVHGETVHVRWVISDEGAVSRVKVEGAHADDAVGHCLQKEVAELRFGHGLRPVPVRFPVRFGDAPANKEPTTHKLSGKLTQKDLDGLLKIVGTDLLKCGEGVVQTEFTIKKTGKVGNIRVSDTDDQTGKCVAQRLTRVRFPAPARPTVVERRFSLDEG